MSGKKIVNFPPIAITGSVANLLNCNTTSLAGPIGYTATQDYLLITRARVINTTAGALPVSFYKGATAGSAAGTEIWAKTLSVPANSYLDVHVGEERFDAADFLTGNSTGTGLTLNLEGEIGTSG